VGIEVNENTTTMIAINRFNYYRQTNILCGFPGVIRAGDGATLWCGNASARK